MAFTKTPFDLQAALAGAKNIWTRDEQPVVFGGYNEEAATPDEIAVWFGLDNTPANYPITGLVNQQGESPLDLLMYQQDTTAYINLFLLNSVVYTNADAAYATQQEAIDAGATTPNYYQTISITYLTDYNNPDIIS